MANINKNNVSLKMSAGMPQQFPSDAKPQIAFSGRSNVGKSSLINSLLGRKSFARVSSTPGKTITVNFYDIDKQLYLVDLPGYGFARRNPEEKKVWSALTDGYFVNNKNIDCVKAVIQLVDIRVGPTDDDIMMINYLIDAALPFFVVATKCDKMSKTALQKTLDEWENGCFAGTGIRVIPYSSVTGEGREKVWSEILSHLS